MDRLLLQLQGTKELYHRGISLKDYFSILSPFSIQNLLLSYE